LKTEALYHTQSVDKSLCKWLWTCVAK